VRVPQAGMGQVNRSATTGTSCRSRSCTEKLVSTNDLLGMAPALRYAFCCLCLRAGQFGRWRAKEDEDENWHVSLIT